MSNSPRRAVGLVFRAFGIVVVGEELPVEHGEREQEEVWLLQGGVLDESCQDARQRLLHLLNLFQAHAARRGRPGIEQGGVMRRKRLKGGKDRLRLLGPLVASHSLHILATHVLHLSAPSHPTAIPEDPQRAPGKSGTSL